MHSQYELMALYPLTSCVQPLQAFSMFLKAFGAKLCLFMQLVCTLM